MDEKRGKSGCPRSSQPKCSITRREFLSTSSKLVAGSVLAATVGMTPGKALGSTLELPAWRSATAKSDIFVVKDIPAPLYSLAGGTLPPGPSNQILRDAGIDALVSLMDRQGTPFFRTAGSPQGLVARDSVVVIKVNQQWVGAGYDSGAGRLGTSTDLIKGLIWRILNHPDGFAGEVVVAENVQDIGVEDFATEHRPTPRIRIKVWPSDQRLPGHGATGFPAELDRRSMPAFFRAATLVLGRPLVSMPTATRPMGTFC